MGSSDSTVTAIAVDESCSQSEQAHVSSKHESCSQSEHAADCSDAAQNHQVVILKGAIAMIRHGKRWACSVKWNRKMRVFVGCMRSNGEAYKFYSKTIESLGREFIDFIDAINCGVEPRINGPA